MTALLAVAGAAAVLVVGAVLWTLVSSSGGDERVAVEPAAVAPSDDPPQAEAPAEPGPPLPPGGPAGFEGAVFQVPVGWVLDDGGDGVACITRGGGCELQLLLPDVAEDRGAELEEIASDDDLGWHVGTDAPDCRSSRLVRRDLAPVDDKRAEYREWELDCTGEPPRLRMWWLPETRFALFDRSGDPVLGPGLNELVRTADLEDLRSG